MALSLGGYYAPRAAALEPRFACCVAWGAQWDYHAIWAKRLDELASGKVLSLSVPPEHLQWVLGVTSQEAALKKLEGFRLDGIVQKMTLSVPAAARRRRRADSAGAGGEMLRGGRLEAEDLEGVPARGGRLPSLPGRQCHHRRALHVGLDRGRVEAGDMSAIYLTEADVAPPRHRQGRDRDAGGAVRHLGPAGHQQPAAPARATCRAAHST